MIREVFVCLVIWHGFELVGFQAHFQSLRSLRAQHVALTHRQTMTQSVIP